MRIVFFMLYFLCCMKFSFFDCLIFLLFETEIKQVLLDARILLGRVDPTIKLEECDPCWNVLKAFWRDFYYKLLFFTFLFSAFFQLKVLTGLYKRACFV